MYLITGGAGFIGSNLTESLLENGNSVRVLDDFSTGKKENLKLLLEKFPKRLEVVEGSICDRSICKDAMKKVKYISHNAAIASVQRSIEAPLETSSVNITGTLNLLQEALSCDSLEKLIFASSSAIYGDIDDRTEEDNFSSKPLSPYAAHKGIAELYMKLSFNLKQLPTLVFRYFNVFGPRQDPNSIYSAVIPIFIKAFINNEAPIIYGDGEQSRDFTYIENVVEANKIAFDSTLCGEIINIACGASINLKTVVSELNTIFNKKFNPVFKDKRSGDIKHSKANISKAKLLLKDYNKISFHEGLKKTVDWFRKEY